MLAQLPATNFRDNTVEPPHGVLGSRENGGQNYQRAGSGVEKSVGSRELGNQFREQGAEEKNWGAGKRGN